MLTAVPTSVLSAIQATGLMVNEKLSRMFLMSELDRAEEHAHLAQDLQKQGLDRPTALAYLDVMPLLVERKAIAAYMAKAQRADLAQVLPNLETPQEAAIVGTRERNLNPTQSANLLQLLERVYR